MARAGRIIRDARRARQKGANAVIVNLHWGTEYQSAPTREQKQLAVAAPAKIELLPSGSGVRMR